LRPSADRPGALAPVDRLPPGTWYVEVDMGSPTIGRCVATVQVAAGTPAPAPDVRCGGSPPPAATEAKPPASPALPSTAAYLLVGGMAVIVVTLAIALRRARRR
jgi:hypothetical protein